MQVFCTDIFRDFFCKGSDCKDNCCKIGWDIEIDDKTYNFYKNLDSELGRKLISEIYEEEGCHYMGQKGGCPFMNEKGLCSVQLTYGEDKISDICREHPRFYQWFGDYKEAGVGISCEKTCEMLINHPNHLEFVTFETDEETDSLDYDEDVLEIVLNIRKYLFEIIQSDKFTLSQKLEFLKKSAEILQEGIDSGDLEEFSESSKQVLETNPENYAEVSQKTKDEFCRNVLDSLNGLEYMHNDFPEIVKKASENSDLISVQITDFPYIWEHLTVYFVFRYFINAVRDFEFVDKINFTLKSITAIYLVLAEIGYEKGSLEKDDFIFAIKEYSKEIEYSDNDF